MLQVDFKNFDLTGKKGIVTGGSRGLSLGMAKALLEKGAELVLVDVNPMVLGVSRELCEAGRPCHAVMGDLSERDSRKKAFDKALGFLKGRLDILVNGAGIQRRNSAIDFNMNDWELVLNIDLTAVFGMCQLAARVMREQGSGKIINVGSMSSFIGNTNICAYTAAKGGILTLTKALANEWGAYGINVNAIAPGHFHTELTRMVQEDREKYETILKRTPLGRWGEPEDVYGPVQFLSSSASDYVTGITMPVDGGYLCM